MPLSITIRSPASTANFGPGFDVFGLALDAFFDEIKIIKKPGNGIKIITSDTIPLDPKKNTAGIVAKNMITRYNIKNKIIIKIKKGIPVGYGIGSSAASSAAVAVGINKLFRLKLDHISLVKFAGIGEKASAGEIHYDNVAASILGGFVIAKNEPLDVIKIEPPRNIVFCLAIPDIKTQNKKTKLLRDMIPKNIKLIKSTYNLANAAYIVTGFMKKNLTIIGNSMNDKIAEPIREKTIPGYYQIKKNAINAGALGVTISGAGPTVIAMATRSSKLQNISSAMKEGFNTKGIKCKTIICHVSKGSEIKDWK